MTPELIVSLTSILVTGLLGIFFYRQFRKQKEQIASLLKAKEKKKNVNGTPALFQMNKPDDYVISPVKRKLQTHQPFKCLPFKEKIIYVQNHGTFLAARHHNEYQIKLYHLHGYFVEVWHSQQTNYPNGMRIFTSKDYLDVYADLINLEME